MSNIKKLMMTAAGGGEALNVEDVFSTYLYTGNGGAQAINNGIALIDGPTGEDGSSTAFNGSTDYLSKSSDLTGNSDGKTFTCSFWVYVPKTVAYSKYVYHTSDSWRNTIYIGNNGMLVVSFYNSGSSGGTAFEIQAGSGVALGGWNHILFSADLTNSANSHLYINDIQSDYAGFSSSNVTVDFTRSAHYIGYNATGASTGIFEGNLAHFFLDYTYRDLSVTSNRRYFIDDAGGSTSVSTQSALNPIIYLPMTSGYSVGQNLGTGGNFTSNGSPTIVTNNGTEAVAGVGQGGMVWLKNRSDAQDNSIYDTERGRIKRIITNSTAAESSNNNSLSFRRNGFSVGPWAFTGYNANDYASWTFRKAPKFFDVVTYTGDGTAGRTISHNLGTTVGAIFIKRTDTTSGWRVFHRSQGGTKYAMLQSTNAFAAASTVWNNTDPTDSVFTVGTDTDTNGSGGTFVAYLFAHNDGDGDFGPTGDQDIIKCGSYTGNGSNDGPEINLGFEPQWVMIKPASISGFWTMFDSMRGMTANGQAGGNKFLQAHSTSVEYDFFNDYYANGSFNVTPTGFKLTGNESVTNGGNQTYIYIAIRRGPMAVPESATDVFAVDRGTSLGSSTYPEFYSGWPVDFFMVSSISTDKWYQADRLRNKRLNSASTAAETSPSWFGFDSNIGVVSTALGGNYYSWMWRRAPSFFDVVAYNGNGVAGRTVSHNLGVAPEMMWVKRRDSSGTWLVYHSGLNVDGDNLPETDYMVLHTTQTAADNNIYWNDTAPSSSSFTLGSNTSVNSSSGLYTAYLFASLDGISKVGSYTGNSSTQNIDCGFTNGARFVLIKCATASNTNWMVMDTERGIVAGNDPALYLNATAAQNTTTDWIDPYSSGFTVNALGDVNSAGETYIYYAIA